MADLNPELKRVKRAAEAEFLNRPGVTGVDIGYKEVDGKPTDVIAIRVLVQNKRDVRPEDRIPEAIEGFPTDVIQRRFEPQVLTRDGADLVTQVDAKEYEQLKGGISIGPWRLVRGAALGGTLGLPVVDKTTGKPMLLSNYHVMCVDKSWSIGDVMIQPARVDQGTNPNSVVAYLQRGVLGDKVDCAVAEVTMRSIECDIVDIGKVSGKTNVPSLGQTVRKRGRTTGLTFGIVDTVDLTIVVNYGPDVGDVTLTNQIGVRPDTTQSPKFSDSGDSGSVLVNDAGDVVGLHCAGNSDEGYGVSNPIDEVLVALNVSICTARQTNLDPRPENPVKRPRTPTLSLYPPPWPPRPSQTPYLVPYLPFPGGPRGAWGAYRTWED
ncbi:MAG: hypothetical protein ACRDXF_07050 [Acidimicrobiia bacterium]